MSLASEQKSKLVEYIHTLRKCTTTPLIIQHVSCVQQHLVLDEYPHLKALWVLVGSMSILVPVTVDNDG